MNKNMNNNAIKNVQQQKFSFIQERRVVRLNCMWLKIFWKNRGQKLFSGGIRVYSVPASLYGWSVGRTLTS